MNLPDHYPPILADIAQLLYARLQSHLPAALAESLALTQTNDVRMTFSGCQIYIPKFEVIDRHQRNAAIQRAFTGHNHAALGRQFGLTVTHVYEILARGALTGQ